ncbi:MAG: UvrD-helicase domain-containing protein [Planctomycetaceae bacterium]|nr:UvrD-helicase domain-containing protein [Planctomycetaceae bacterium]
MTLKNTLIKASAGSGKTFQLSNRYLQLIFNEVRPETILATTFTRKAAGEILDRILERLAEAAFDDEKRLELSKHVLHAGGDGQNSRSELSRHEILAMLARLMQNVHRLRVSTLDGFFQQIAGNLSLELGMPPGWLIMEEDERSPLLNEGIRLFLEQSGREKVVRLMHLLFKGETKSRVVREMIELVNGLMKVYEESEPGAWERLQPAKELSAGEIKRLAYSLSTAEIALTKKGAPNMDMQKARDKDLAMIRESLENGQPVDWETLGKNGLCPKVLDGTCHYKRADMPESLSAVYDQIVQQVRAAVINRLVVQTKAMGVLLREITVIVDGLKTQSRMFDFSDVTRRLAQTALDDKLLQVTYRLDADTQHLLLDEFQDTSPNQWQVLKPFAERVVAKKKNSTPAAVSFFCVGDVKQAIYGWRGGVAEIFDAIENDLGKLDEEHLDTSYRSCKPVIDTVNEVFGSIAFNAALCGDSASQSFVDAAVRWGKRFVVHQTKKSELQGYCSMRTSSPPREKFDAEGNRIAPTSVERKQAHLRNVIDEIIALHDKSPDSTIGVLTRTNDMIQNVIYGLRLRGIEASEEGGNSLDKSPAVELILSALSLADYPGNRVAWFHVAHSPLAETLGVTLDSLTTTSSEADTSWKKAEMQIVSHRIRKRLLEEGYPNVIHDWVTKLAPSCDDRDCGKLVQLIELACMFQKKSKVRTKPFIDFIRLKKVENPSESMLRVMSIHKSKGLQFDIVVLPELDVDLVGAKTPKVVAGREHATGPISTVLAYPARDIRAYLPVEYQKLVSEAETARIEESLCLLYVGMTRAVHELKMIVMPKAETSKKTVKKTDSDETSDQTAGFAATMTGVLHAALAGSMPLTENTVLFEKGERDWIEPEQKTDSPGQRTDSFDAEADEHELTIALAPLRSDSAKNLKRMTPSGQEGRDDESENEDEDAEKAENVGILQNFDMNAAVGGGNRMIMPVFFSGFRQTGLSHAAQPHPAQLWGIAMHACFEKVTWLDLDMPSRETVLAAIEQAVQKQWNAGQVNQAADVFFRWCDQPGIRFALERKTYQTPASESSPTGTNALLFSAVHRPENIEFPVWEIQNERRFSVVPKPGILLRGSIDRLTLLYDGAEKQTLSGADIIDFKTDKIPNEETLLQRVQYYLPQLAEYKKAVAIMYRLPPERITARLLFPDSGGHLEYPLC